MKTSVTLVLIALFMQIRFVYANSNIFFNKKDSVIYLEIRGKAIVKEKVKDNEYKVELLENNKVIDSTFESDNELFAFGLLKNRYYAIKIYKKGYLPKLIIVNTNLPEKKYLQNYFVFEFETELISVIEEDKLDPDTKDFPVAIIQFDKLKEGFNYNQQYSINITKQLYKQNASNNE